MVSSKLVAALSRLPKAELAKVLAALGVAGGTGVAGYDMGMHMAEHNMNPYGVDADPYGGNLDEDYGIMDSMGDMFSDAGDMLGDVGSAIGGMYDDTTDYLSNLFGGTGDAEAELAFKEAAIEFDMLKRASAYTKGVEVLRKVHPLSLLGAGATGALGTAAGINSLLPEPTLEDYAEAMKELARKRIQEEHADETAKIIDTALKEAALESDMLKRAGAAVGTLGLGAYGLSGDSTEDVMRKRLSEYSKLPKGHLG